MTLWKQGASAVPVLARLRVIFGSAGIGIGRACCPIGTALVTEFAPRRIRATKIVMGVVGVALPRMIRSRARAGTADAPCFQRVISLFSLCYLLLKKLSKSLITLSDCPFVLNRLPVFLGKSPCFREKTDSQAMGLAKGEAVSAARVQNEIREFLSIFDNKYPDAPSMWP